MLLHVVAKQHERRPSLAKLDLECIEVKALKCFVLHKGLGDHLELNSALGLFSVAKRRSLNRVNHIEQFASAHLQDYSEASPRVLNDATRNNVTLLVVFFYKQLAAVLVEQASHTLGLPEVNRRVHWLFSIDISYKMTCTLAN